MSWSFNISGLAALVPFSSFAASRLRDLLEYCHVETLEQGVVSFVELPRAGHSVYLLKGELEVAYTNGNHILINADSESARHPIGKRQPGILSAKATTPIQLLRVDDMMLDQILTWDQFVYPQNKTERANPAAQTSEEKIFNAGMFNAGILSHSPFLQVPPANIGKLMNEVETIEVWNNEVIIREGEETGGYYQIVQGKAQLTRWVDGSRLVTRLKEGDIFGGEMLHLGTKQQPAVTMKSAGVLLRLKMRVLSELMQEPMQNKISFGDAAQKIAKGAVWLDVRHPSEYRYDKLPNAINVPLKDVHNASGRLSKDPRYIVYCQSGRRSAAAAFMLGQAGYKVDVLENGLWSIPVLQ